MGSEPRWLTDFFRAVYPEMTDLAVTMAHTEKQLLTDATTTINNLRAELALAQPVLDAVEQQVVARDSQRALLFGDYKAACATTENAYVAFYNAARAAEEGREGEDGGL